MEIAGARETSNLPSASRRGARETWTVDIDAFRRRLLDEAPDAILISDPEGIIRFWNPGAVRIFGFTSDVRYEHLATESCYV